MKILGIHGTSFSPCRALGIDVLKRNITKVNILGEGQGIVLCADFLYDKYIHFRNNLKRYLEIVIESHWRFFELYESMKEENRKVLEAAQSLKPAMGDISSKIALS
jgi:hypothetical protein